MTAPAPGTEITALRRAASQAVRAPSVHNTQPWRLESHPGRLDIYADYSRRLAVLDPSSRQLVISCGCAVMNARVSLASSGFGVEVVRTASLARTDLMASLRLTGSTSDADLGALDPMVEARITNRRRFDSGQITRDALRAMTRAARVEHASLVVVRDAPHRQTVVALSQHADYIESHNVAYRTELDAWTTDDGNRRDGVPGWAVPQSDDATPEQVPIRDFDTHGNATLPRHSPSSDDCTLALLCTDLDSPDHWLRAGEALERVLLEITRGGYVASPHTQVIEVPVARAQLRRDLGLTGYPHVLLRIGRAPATPPVPRRPLDEVLSEFQ